MSAASCLDTTDDNTDSGHVLQRAVLILLTITRTAGMSAASCLDTTDDNTDSGHVCSELS